MRTWCAKHVLLGVLLLAPGLLRAQVAAAISGHVEDPSSVGVPKVTAELQPGTYRYEAKLSVGDQQIALKLSTTIAIPCPPPMHAVASPYFFFRRRNS